MEAAKLNLNVQAQPNNGIPALAIAAGRVTVLLGANGMGKSKLLSVIRVQVRSLAPKRTVTFVEGGRVPGIPTTLDLTINDFAGGGGSDFIASHEKKRSAELSHRLRDAFMRLDRESDAEKTRHSDAAVA